MTGVAEADVAHRPAPQRVPRPRGGRRRRPAMSVRRPPPVHEDGDAPHPPRAHPVPRGGGGHVAARRGAGPRRARRRVADRPADRDAGPAARQEPGLRCARPRDRAGRATSRRTSPCSRTASRSPARRSGSTTRCRSAATRSTRTGSGRRRTSSCATPPAGRCGTPPVPLTDAVEGRPYGILAVPGPRHRPAAAARPKISDGTGHRPHPALPGRSARTPDGIADRREPRRGCRWPCGETGLSDEPG